MSSEDQNLQERNKELTHRIIEECTNQQKVDLLDVYLHDDIVDHHAQVGQKPGREGYKDVLKQTFRSFPDLHATIEDVVAEGDLVMFRGTVRGTNTGDLESAGLPATGKKMEFAEMMAVRFENGKAVEMWGLRDEASLAQQLGLMSPMTLVKKLVYTVKQKRPSRH